jgi:hypothetical protein
MESIIIVVLVSAIIGLIPAYIAKNKGHSFVLFWIYGTLFFIVALSHAMLMKANPEATEKKSPDAGKGIFKEPVPLEPHQPVVLKSEPAQPAVEPSRTVRQDVGFYQYDMMTIEMLKTGAVCSDKECRYPDTSIPDGSGYLYISPDAVVRMKSIMDGSAAGTFGIGLMPILMCKRCAKRRGIDLKTAADDARRWWITGRVPLRPTPMA